MDVVGPDSVDEVQPRRVSVTEYGKKDCRDNVLDPNDRLVQFLLSLVNKANVGVLINDFNT